CRCTNMQSQLSTVHRVYTKKKIMESFNMTYNDVVFLCKSDNDVLCALLYVFLTSLTLITVFGNLLVIISIAYFKQLHTPTNYLILSLAVLDLIIGAVIFPLNMTYTSSTCLAHITLQCLIRNTIDFMASLMSILNLCCIAVDRYYAVCHPLLYKTKITLNSAVTMTLSCWGSSVLGGLLYFGLGITNDSCYDLCFKLLLILSGFTFYIPTAVLLCIYARIFVVAQKQARSIQNAASQFGATDRKMENKATKTLAIVLGIYILCWAPLLVSYPLNDLSRFVLNLIEPFNWFALCNSMFNPFIYAFFYRWFRSAIRMIISGKIFQGNLANTKLH
uniref:G-protein coupled receptors family 1 profile domain-containing protein n=1 Tax=Stegastes partitus TaxID=144197 RepID=A0A3B5BJV8_9TELE